MAATLLQFDFPFDGPWGDDSAAAMGELAASIADEPGLVWKIWTENPDARRAGGIYLFEDAAAAERYREKHARRLAEMGVRDVVAHGFSVNAPLSAVTRAPL